ncbi:protein of unknown function [Candidatus Methylomirabilis oxygeniifera]|uniref:Uncharacterized protein n=1 Tax=Methylomirabilis oxygeniifera TaxID=671143 RepID=D5MFW0_METO1|nr:protein of unknown function [Candidatus Methylomirabilis oxyfera]
MRRHPLSIRRSISPQGESSGRELLDAERPALGLCLCQIELELLAEPALRSGAEGDRQTDRHLRANAGAAVQDTRERLATDPERVGRFGYGQTEWLKAELAEHLTRMGRIVHLHSDTSQD